MDSQTASTKEQMRELAGKSRTMTTIDDIRDHQNRSLHSAISEGFNSRDYETDMPASHRVTLEDVVHLPNKAHNALADGFERIAHAMVMPDRNCVSLDEVMLHQNRVLHNEDGFQSEDYMKHQKPFGNVGQVLFTVKIVLPGRVWAELDYLLALSTVATTQPNTAGHELFSLLVPVATGSVPAADAVINSDRESMSQTPVV
uniref:Uncharacterized protein n=1 Tax=Plectus sambesii TaxID=2011161 RepID=A0A914VTW3_9BILA